MRPEEAAMNQLTVDQYHADDTGAVHPSLSASVASLLISRSPAHAWTAHPRLNPDYQHEDRTTFDLGTAAHSILLEGEDRIVDVPYDNWRTNAAQEQRDAARAAGMVPLLVKQADRVREMVRRLREQILEFDDPVPLFANPGRPEVPLVFTEDGVLCRSLIDWLHDDWTTVDDFKTTSGSSSPETWSRGPFWNHGCDIQAVFHSRAVQALSGERPDFRFVVAETHPPYAVSVFRPGPDVLAVAESKVAFALDVWRECLSSGRWPAYPPRVATIELPPWEEARWLEREARDE